MKKMIFVGALCVFATSVFAQQAPSPLPSNSPQIVDEHDQNIRLHGVADNLLRKLQQSEVESLGCSGDLASEQGKFNNDEAKIQALTKEVADLKNKYEPAPAATPAP